jgi:hypothetical protein
MNKTIPIRQYKIDYETLSKEFPEIIPADTEASIDGFISKGKLYLKSSADKSNPLVIVSNDHTFDHKFLDKEDTITLKLADPAKSFSTMPEYGFTIDDNISVHQFTVDKDMADKLISNNGFHYWGMDKQLHVNAHTYKPDTVIEYANRILEKGYSYPIVCYVDTTIQIEKNDYIPYLHELLEIGNVPFRIMTYKDIRYLMHVTPELYTIIYGIPSNKRYQKEDSVDISSFLLTNYSDKRDAIKNYQIKVSKPEDSEYAYIDNPFDQCFSYYFIFDSDHAFLNDRLITNIINRNDLDYVSWDGDESGDMAAGMHLKNALYGRTPVKQIHHAHPGEAKDTDAFEEYCVEHHIDLGLFDMLSFGYSNDKIEFTKSILDKFKADLIVIENDQSALLGVEMLQDLLDKDDLCIKYLKLKK